MFEVRCSELRNTKNPSDRWEPAKKMVSAPHDQRTGFLHAHNIRLVRRWQRRSLQNPRRFWKVSQAAKIIIALSIVPYGANCALNPTLYRKLSGLCASHIGNKASPTVPKMSLDGRLQAKQHDSLSSSHIGPESHP